MLHKTIGIEQAVHIFKLLGNETRLTMLKILDNHDCCVCEFVEIFQVSQPSISQHIRKFRDIGIVTEDKRGQWIFYSLNKESELYPIIIQLLNLLPEQNKKLKKLEETGVRMTCN